MLLCIFGIIFGKSINAKQVNNKKIIYVSQKRNKKSTGSKKYPFVSLQKAIDKADAGTVIYIREGNYKGPFIFHKSGNKKRGYITIAAYKNEKVNISNKDNISAAVFDMGGQSCIKIQKLHIGNIKAENVMIYPTPLKDRSTLMVPYSDLFRNFQNHLAKPNAVLITLGYSFGDDHINRVILDNLSIPSFRLIIFGDAGTEKVIDGQEKDSNILRLLKAHDPRIIVVNSENKIHYFESFINKIMPSPLVDVQENQKLSEAIRNIGSVLQAGDQLGK